MSDVEVIQVIRTTLATRGTGVVGDPIRRPVQYWSMDGELLWEHDPRLEAQIRDLEEENERINRRQEQIDRKKRAAGLS